MPKIKPVVFHLNSNFVDIIKDLMRDPDFPFDNVKHFIELSCYELSLNFHAIKSNSDELNKFKIRMKTHAQNLIKRELISKKPYGWKPT